LDGDCLAEPRNDIGYSLNRDYYLQVALDESPRIIENHNPGRERTADRILTSCDADGRLWGIMLTDPSGAIRDTETAAECPAEPEEQPSIGTAEELMGSDLYPALVICSYVVKRVSDCGGLGNAPLRGL
jgi:hypothetical protein